MLKQQAAIRPASDDSLPAAVALLAAGNTRDAAQQLKQICAESPARAIARAYLGVALLRTGHVAEARAELEESIRLAPQSFVCRFRYGEFLARLGFYDQAVDQINIALGAPAPDRDSYTAAIELLRFAKEHARDIYYRRTASPTEVRLRNFLPRRISGSSPTTIQRG
jgi:Tfp pilus assembly protein PilF